MPSVVDLQQIRSQEIFIQLDGVQHELRVYATNNSMAYDITRDNNVVLRGSRLVNGEALIPFDYLEAGNLILIATDDRVADYNQFGLTQTLLYFTQAELDAL